MGEIWAIVLAAGESKRMGFPKMLLNINGITMLERVIKNVQNSSVDNILVVLGANKEEISELLKKSPVKLCYNDNYMEGMLSSVKCGFCNVPSVCDAILVFQGDQPFISPESTNKLIEAYRSSGKGLIIPVFENKRGHPLLIDRKYLDQISALKSSEGLRSLACQFPGDVIEVETDDQGILKGFNTFEEFKKEMNLTCIIHAEDKR